MNTAPRRHSYMLTDGDLFRDVVVAGHRVARVCYLGTRARIYALDRTRGISDRIPAADLPLSGRGAAIEEWLEIGGEG